MKSEVAKLASHRKSLMGMLAHNEDFSYPVSLKSAKSALTTAYSQAATSRLIEEDRYQSVMDKCAEVSHSSIESYLHPPWLLKFRLFRCLLATLPKQFLTGSSFESHKDENRWRDGAEIFTNQRSET